jgi:hypothetical protein
LEAQGLLRKLLTATTFTEWSGTGPINLERSFQPYSLGHDSLQILDNQLAWEQCREVIGKTLHIQAIAVFPSCGSWDKLGKKRRTRTYKLHMCLLVVFFHASSLPKAASDFSSIQLAPSFGYQIMLIPAAVEG